MFYIVWLGTTFVITDSNMKEQTKICNKCRIEKILRDFYKNKSGRFGVEAICKICRNKQTLKRRKVNPESHRIASKKWRKANPDKVRVMARKWCLANPEKIKTSAKIAFRKRKKDPKFRLNRNIRTVIGVSLQGNKNGNHWEDLVGYTLCDLKKHLEKQFTDGMTWENYGKWHIDHKIPVSVFNFTKPEHIDFKKCWTLDNLQPLWAKDNLKKYNKLNKHFQPSLLL